MKKTLLIFLISLVIITAGCLGGETTKTSPTSSVITHSEKTTSSTTATHGSTEGLTKGDLLSVLDNITTVRYTIKMTGDVELTNLTSNETIDGEIYSNFTGSFDLKNSLGFWDLNISVKAPGTNGGMEKEMGMKYFVNGTKTYVNLNGQWFRVNTNIPAFEHRREASLEIDYVKRILRKTDSVLRKTGAGYVLVSNVTFNDLRGIQAELGNLIGGIFGMRVTTNKGVGRVYFDQNGTPRVIKTYIDFTITFKEDLRFRYRIHKTTVITDINKARVPVPRGIEDAPLLNDGSSI
ncbi:hypothetical protein A3L09_03710 [Thermococcus profundus]|uniref:Uncharacterized protein n=1 Tax=Thermococcus profundus TaxID=49899 RepID=A0A2Z2MJ14_THEPR|nr:hypothetical protein [Thermococcus profundus]ASJ02421.1 hypothetical protein A3L09_03710 [Thermococcus profundus]